jgi:ribonuclease P/MRP protein subunit POP1
MGTVERMEFDTPGQKPSLPEGVAIVDHVSSRVRELKKLFNDIASTKSEMLVHQMLPNHMRRRAMSHNPKRLPLKYRQIHINQMAKSGPNAKKRRPSRKYRRKASNLMKEYTRRKQKNVWLETHIWHAKRYHMKELWGYKIPFAPTDKRYRASYKAAANHCLLQDFSFVGAIEVSGPIEELKDKFRLVTSQDCGLTLMAKCFQNGTREGQVDLFRANSYPNQALARVNFLWKPTEDSKKTVWIFVHPTAYQEVLEEFVSLFQLQNCNRNGNSEEVGKDVTRNDSQLRNPRYVNSQSKVEVTELKDTLNRFRLTGPFSNAVLLKALKITSHFENNWLGKLFDDAKHQKAHVEQEKVFTQLRNVSSPSEVPPHVVVGLNVVDPRTNRPAKREKAVNEIEASSEYIQVQPIAASSGIWSKEIRDEVTKNMMPSGELCKLRNKNQLVPGIASSFEKDLQPIPLLLIQRPGSQSPELKRLGFGSGWDVIVPAGYGMSVWLSFIKCGAKSGGWRETETITSEMGSELFLPDTVSGMKESQRQSKAKRDEYFRKPPNKRTNFKKMGISAPFECPLSQLVKEWNGGDDCFVLRSREKLEAVGEALRSKKNIEDLKIHPETLIPLAITMETRGTPSDLGILCVPTKRDIKNSLALKHRRDRGPIEPLIKDDAEKERKMMRSDHKKLLKRLRNRRVRAKRKLQATSDFFVKIQKSSAEKIIEKQFEQMCELWVPKKPPTVRNQCSRPVFGYLTQSRFTFSEGKVCGLGYVTRDGLSQLLSVFQKFQGLKPFLLTRAINSQCYSTAKLNVRTNL